MDASSGNRVKRRSVWVPLPTPGAPTRIMRAAFLSCLDAIDILDVLVDRVVVLFRTAQGARNGRVAQWVCVVGANEISEVGRYVIAGVIGYTSWTGAGLNLKNRFTDDAEATFLLIELGGGIVQTGQRWGGLVKRINCSGDVWLRVGLKEYEAGESTRWIPWGWRRTVDGADVFPLR